MRSRTSYFNTTIFFKNITRFWPIWTSYTLVCLWCLPIYSWMRMRSYIAVDTVSEAERLEGRLINVIDSLSQAVSPVPIFLFAGISGIAVFSYLYQARSANMIHGLPVRREELFLTNYVSGLLFLAVPQLLAFLVTIFVWFANGVNQLEYLLQWLGLALGQAALAYSLAVFAAMLTGQAAAAAVYVILLNYLFKGIGMILNVILRASVYGMGGDAVTGWGDWLSPLPFLKEHVRIQYQRDDQILTIPEIGGQEYIPGCLAAALLLAVLALLIYRRRAVETASEVISISWMKPLFRWCGGFAAAGVCTYMVWESLFSGKNGDFFWMVLLCCCVAGTAGFFLCEMAIQKKFRIFTKKRMLEGGVFLTATALFLVCVEQDVFGMESRLPDEQDISGIYMDGSYVSYLKEPEEIEQCLLLHKMLIDSKEEYESYFQPYARTKEPPYMVLNLTYEMKNGRVIKRSYALPLEDYYVEEADGAVGKLLAMEKDPEKYLEYYFSSAYGSMELKSGCSYSHIDEKGDYQNRNFSTEDAQKLYEALKEDIRSGNYRIYPYDDPERETKVYGDTLNFEYTIPKGARIFQMSEEKFYTGEFNECANIQLTTACERTIALLRELGYLGQEEELLTERECQKVWQENAAQ